MLNSASRSVARWRSTLVGIKGHTKSVTWRGWGKAVIISLMHAFSCPADDMSHMQVEVNGLFETLLTFWGCLLLKGFFFLQAYSRNSGLTTWEQQRSYASSGESFSLCVSHPTSKLLTSCALHFLFVVDLFVKFHNKK